MSDMNKAQLKTRRKARVRGRINGTALRPRLSVFISNRAVSAQIIDDQSGRTLASSLVKADKKSMTTAAVEAGQQIAAAATKAKVKSVVFDRNTKTYQGRLAALADAARKSGLEL